MALAGWAKFVSELIITFNMLEMLKDRYLDKKCLGNQPPIRSLFTYFLLGLHLPCPLFQRGKST